MKKIISFTGLVLVLVALGCFGSASITHAYDVSTFDHNLRIGVRDSDVKALQSFLIGTGYLNVNAPTGYYGTATAAAVKEYQKDQDISPTGTVGPKTRLSLGGAISAFNADVVPCGAPGAIVGCTNLNSGGEDLVIDLSDFDCDLHPMYCAGGGTGKPTDNPQNGGGGGNGSTGTPDTSLAANSIEISPPRGLNLIVSGKESFEVVVRNQKGEVISNPRVNWSSADPSVATVNSDGTVTGVSAGTTNVTAKSGDVSASAPVTVEAPKPVSISIRPAFLRLLVGGQEKLQAQVNNQISQAMPDQTITWSSDDSKIATVGADGIVTAVALGNTKIQAKSGSLSALPSSVTVTATTSVPTSVVIAPTGITSIAAGSTQTFVAVVKDENGKELADVNIVWQGFLEPEMEIVSKEGNSITIKSVYPGTYPIQARGIGTSATAGKATLKITAAPAGSSTIGDPSRFGGTFGLNVGDSVTTTSVFNVRAAAAGSALGAQARGVSGTILSGPIRASLGGTAYDWYNVNFSSGVDGWVAATGLEDADTGIPGAPEVTIDLYNQNGVSTSNFKVGDTETIKWSATNMDGTTNPKPCTWSGAWLSGAYASSGSVTSSSVVASSWIGSKDSYTLTCTNAAGLTGSVSAQATFSAAPTTGGLVVDVPGNLLKNPSFENGLENWNCTSQRNVGGTWTANSPSAAWALSSTAHGGSKSITISDSINTDKEWVGCYQSGIAFKPNTKYSLSGYYNCPAGEKGGFFLGDYIAYGAINSTGSYDALSCNGTWQPFSASITTNSEVKALGVYVYGQYSSHGVSYDDLSLTASASSAPSASFTTTPSCAIPSGKAGCNTPVSWTSANVTKVLLTDTRGRDGYYTSTGPGPQTSSVYIPYKSGSYQIMNDADNAVLAKVDGTSNCDKATSWNGTLCVPDSASAATITNFTATPNGVSTPVNFGDKVVFTWKTENAVSCSGPWGTTASSQLANNSTSDVWLYATSSTYTLTCLDAAGRPTMKDVAVKIKAGAYTAGSDPTPIYGGVTPAQCSLGGADKGLDKTTGLPCGCTLTTVNSTKTGAACFPSAPTSTVPFVKGVFPTIVKLVPTSPSSYVRLQILGANFPTNSTVKLDGGTSITPVGGAAANATQILVDLPPLTLGNHTIAVTSTGGTTSNSFTVPVRLMNGQACNTVAYSYGSNECESGFCEPGPGGKNYCVAATSNCAWPGTDGKMYSAVDTYGGNKYQCTSSGYVNLGSVSTPAIASFTAGTYNSSAKSVQLYWTTTNAKYCALGDASTPTASWNSVSVNPGSAGYTVPMSLTTTFTLKCSDLTVPFTDAQATANVIVTATPPATSTAATTPTLAPVVSFTADKASIKSGETVNLAMSIRYTKSCTMTSTVDGVTTTVADVGPDPRDTWDIMTTHVYPPYAMNPTSTISNLFITCKNSIGSTSSTPITITVAPATAATIPTVSISASPNPIAVGQSGSIIWKTTNATSCDNGGVNNWPSPGTTVNGSYPMNPKSGDQGVYTYHLTCYNGTGGPSKSADTGPVTIVSASTSSSSSSSSSSSGGTALTADLKANGSDGPITITSGNNVNFTWTSNGTQCMGNSDVFYTAGAFAASGSGASKPIIVSRPAQLLCFDASGKTATDTVIINITGKAPYVPPTAANALSGFSSFFTSTPKSISSCVDLTHGLGYKSSDEKGDTNGEVGTLQDFLKSKSFFNADVSGYFGMVTYAAVKDFQVANGMKGDGFVGSQTRAKIHELTCN